MTATYFIDQKWIRPLIVPAGVHAEGSSYERHDRDLTQ